VPSSIARNVWLRGALDSARGPIACSDALFFGIDRYGYTPAHIAGRNGCPLCRGLCNCSNCLIKVRRPSTSHGAFADLARHHPLRPISKATRISSTNSSPPSAKAPEPSPLALGSNNAASTSATPTQMTTLTIPTPTRASPQHHPVGREPPPCESSQTTGHPSSRVTKRYWSARRWRGSGKVGFGILGCRRRWARNRRALDERRMWCESGKCGGRSVRLGRLGRMVS